MTKRFMLVAAVTTALALAAGHATAAGAIVTGPGVSSVDLEQTLGPGKRHITIAAVEPKGGTTVDKEAFPTVALPEGKGYVLKAPNDEGRWEVSTYQFMPSQIIVNEGDDVTLICRHQRRRASRLHRGL